jgi:hypothetical protein
VPVSRKAVAKGIAQDNAALEKTAFVLLIVSSTFAMQQCSNFSRDLAVSLNFYSEPKKLLMGNEPGSAPNH